MSNVRTTARKQGIDDYKTSSITRHPTLWASIRTLRKSQKMRDVYYTECESGSGGTRKKRKYEILDERIPKIVEEYTDGQRTTISNLFLTCFSTKPTSGCFWKTDSFIDNAYIRLLSEDSEADLPLGVFWVTLTSFQIRAEFLPNLPRAQSAAPNRRRWIGRLPFDTFHTRNSSIIKKSSSPLGWTTDHQSVTSHHKTLSNF